MCVLYHRGILERTHPEASEDEIAVTVGDFYGVRTDFVAYSCSSNSNKRQGKG